MAEANPNVVDSQSADKELENWDPRLIDYFSTQNLIHADADNELGFLHASKGFKQPRTLAEVPCKFLDKKTGKCWKGPSCKYSHDPEALQRESVAGFYKLEKPTELLVGGVYKCVITNFTDFSDFYVVPKSSYVCMCEHIAGPDAYKNKHPNCTFVPVNREYNEEGQATTIEGPVTQQEGFEALLKMESALKATLEKDSKWQSLRNAYYEKTELVAVKSTAGRWERGVVLNENANDAVGREIPTCEVQLIDRGPVIEVSMSRLCNLPLQFCYIPASAIKCCLAEVAPVRFTWLKRACSQWSNILRNQEALVVVRETPSTHTKIVSTSADDPSAPYLVDVIIKPAVAEKGYGNAKFRTNRYLSDIVVDQGLGVKASKFPFRPELDRRYRNRTVEELLLPSQNLLVHKPVAREIEEFELERFRDIVEIESHEGLSANEIDNSPLPLPCNEYMEWPDLKYSDISGSSNSSSTSPIKKN